jgi:hypothetical protein
MDQLELSSQVSDVKLCSILPKTDSKGACMYTVSGETICLNKNQEKPFPFVDGSDVIKLSRSKVEGCESLKKL